MRDEAPRPVPKPGGTERQKRVNAKQRGTYAERQVAKRLAGRRVYKSGASPLEKGDVKAQAGGLNLFVEVKYTGTLDAKGAHSVTFKREWVEKTVLDAQAAGCVPVIALRFNDGFGLYLTTGAVFEELVRQVREANGASLD